MDKPDLICFRGVSFSDAVSGYEVKDINFTLKRGENLVLLGSEGCGKGLIVSLLTARLYAGSGEVLFYSKDVTSFSHDETERMRAKIGYVSYNYGLINNMSIYENVALPLRYHTQMNEQEIKQLTYMYLDKYELSQKINVRPQSLNESERLRVAFIRALMVKPEILVIDHALDAQCPLAMARFIDLASEDVQSNNMSLILTSYGASFFFYVRNRYLLLYRGSVVFEGTGEELLAAKEFHPYVRQYLVTPLHGPMHSFYSQEVLNEV